MKSPYNYSIIIPHHNCPQLLERLIASIPRRDDIQIIVVDDASDSGIVDWNTFKLDSTKNIELYLISKEESKWAGHARNVGLEHAEGKWLLFADSDDYYQDGAFDVLDQFVNGQDDIIYFNCGSVDSDTLEPSNRGKALNKHIDKYLSNPTNDNLDVIKYRLHAPWNKMIRHSLVKDKEIGFEEVIKGNDIQFTILTGYFAKQSKVIKDIIYVCTKRRGNMTFGRQSEAVRYRVLQSHYFKNAFYDYLGKKEWKMRSIDFYSKYIAKSFTKLGWRRAIPFLLKAFGHKNICSLHAQKNKYVDLILEKI